MKNQFHFGTINKEISRKKALEYDDICIEEGGFGYFEVNRKEGDSPDINNGHYYGWFAAPNYGSPFDSDLREKVLKKCGLISR